VQTAYTDLTFEEWILFTFDHSVEGPVWYHAFDDDLWDGPAAVTIAYLTQLFTEPDPALDGYSDEQIGQGLWYLVGFGAGDYLRTLLDPTVPLADRLTCIAAIPTLFDKLIAPRVGDHLGHLDRGHTPPLAGAAYMWWDIAPLGGDPNDDELAAINEACLDAMERVLHLPSDACRESALHGLGHWSDSYPKRCLAIIERFLEEQRGELRPEVLRYAEIAKSGCIL
jgi:hypothetical protein